MYASKVVPDHMRDDPVLWGKTTNLKVIVKELIRCTADRPYPSVCLFDFSRPGEGMGGSLFWKDLISLAHSVGFGTPHLVSASHIEIYNSELKAKAGNKKGTLTFDKMKRSFSLCN